MSFFAKCPSRAADQIAANCDDELPEGFCRAVASMIGVDAKPPAFSCLADAMYQSKSHRIGPSPTAAQTAFVNGLCCDGQVLNTLTPWGALKGYGLFGLDVGADMLDAMAVQRLVSTLAAMRPHAKGGIKSVVMMEDTTERLLNPLAADQPLVCYAESLRSLFAVYGGENIEVIAESGLIERGGFSEAEVMTQARVNGVKISAAVKAGHHEREQLLNKIGWRGGIADETIHWYLERARTEQPTATREVLIDSISLYFGMSLARRQFGYLSSGGAPMLKLSFAPYPPGVSDSLMLGRVDLKVKPTKNNHTLPPWVGFGFFDSALKFESLGVAGMRTAAFKPVNITIRAKRPVGDFPILAEESAAFSTGLLM